jgi:hypothetical protein
MDANARGFCCKVNEETAICNHNLECLHHKTLSDGRALSSMRRDQGSMTCHGQVTSLAGGHGSSPWCRFRIFCKTCKDCPDRLGSTTIHPATSWRWRKRHSEFQDKRWTTMEPGLGRGRTVGDGRRKLELGVIGSSCNGPSTLSRRRSFLLMRIGRTCPKRWGLRFRLGECTVPRHKVHFLILFFFSHYW